MQSDQTVSLRPGGGKGRLFGPRSNIASTGSSSISSANSFSDPLFPPRPNHDGLGLDSRTQRPQSERIKYSREELYKYREVVKEIPQDLRTVISEIEAELSVSEESEWARLSPNAQVLPSATRYTETDNRDWKSRAPLPSPTVEDKGKDGLKDIGKRSDSDWRDKDQEYEATNYQTARQQEPQHSYRQQEPQYAKQPEPAAAAGPAPAIVRASNPWSARSGAVSEKDKVLRTVKGILNKLTPEKFELLLGQLLNAGIDSAEILKGVISLVFDKAVLEPTFCPMYAELCVHLSKALPEFPSDEDEGKPVTFRRILLNSCQEEFEGAANMRAEIQKMTKAEDEVERFEKEKLLKLRTLGNIRLIGELFKLKVIPEKIVHYCVQMLLGPDSKTTPAEENLEALCQLFLTVGKELDESAKSGKASDIYFSQLKDFSKNSRLPARIRFMIQNAIDTRGNKWVPRREEVKAKTINEIHAEAEQTLGLRPGLSVLRNGRGVPGGISMSALGNNFPITRNVGVMPGMPSLLPGGGKVQGATNPVPDFHPVVDSEGWELYTSKNKNKIPREGLIPAPNVMPGRPLGGTPATGPRPNSASSKLLPQGSGGLFYGRSSALLGDSAVKTAPPIPRQNVGVLEPLNQGQFGTNAKPPEKEKVNVPSPKQTAVPALSSAALEKKSDSLLKEYFSVGDLNEAKLCVEELQNKDFHPQLVQMAVLMLLEAHERQRDLVGKLLEFLWSKKVMSTSEITSGIAMVAEQLEDLVYDAPLAPMLVGNLVGKLLLSEVVSLGLLQEILQKMEEIQPKKVVYDAVMGAVKAGPNAERVLSQQVELRECEKLVEAAR